MQFVHDGGLADTRIAGNQDQLGRAVSHDAVEGGEQRVDLALPPVEPLRDQQTVRRVVPTQREGLDAAGRLAIHEAFPQIDHETGGGLVTVLGGLGEELHHDRRERPRDACDPLVGRHRLPCDVAVHPFHRISGGEGQRPRQHLVERDSQRIEIAAGVDRAIHPAGLFRRHVGERSGDHLGRLGAPMLAGQAGGNSETGEPGAAACPVHQDIGRLDVLMNEAPLMHAAECSRERHGDA